MQLGLAISLLVHTGLLAWAYLVMLSTPELKPPEPEPITVALITPSELLRLKQGSETAKELEAKAKEEPKPEISKTEAEKPKPVTAPTPPEEPPAPKEEAEPTPPPEPPKAEPPKPDAISEKLAALPAEPPPGPTPDEIAKKLAQEKQAEDAKRAEEQRKAEEAKKKAEEKRKAEEKKKADELKKKKLAEAKKKAEEKKKKADTDRLAALLDKDPTKKGAPQSALPPEKETDYTGPTAGASEGNDSVLSVREQDLLRGLIVAQLRNCWKLPGGGGGIETMVVTIKWHLRPDGSLEGEPAIVEPQSGPVYQIAAEAAIRAVKTCQPFNLPADKYLAWKTIIWDFDPRQML